MAITTIVDKPTCVIIARMHTMIHMPNTTACSTSPRSTNSRIRAARALEMRLGGASFGEIADELGMKSRGSARVAYLRGLRAVQPLEGVADMRRQLILRAERLLIAVLPYADGSHESC